MTGLFHYNCNLSHQVDHANAFKKCGFDTTPSPYVEGGDFHVISGPHFAYEQWKHSTPLMIDRAWWGDPDYVSIFWLMPDGTRRYASGTEPRPYPEMEPWGTAQDNVLILADYQQITTAVEVFAKMTFGNVTVRKHPAEEKHTDSLEDALMKADIVIGHSGTAVFDAIRLGRPTVCTDSRNPCAPVCTSWVGAELYRGDRSAWLHDMSYKQWSLSEISSGEAWEALQDVL